MALTLSYSKLPFAKFPNTQQYDKDNFTDEEAQV